MPVVTDLFRCSARGVKGVHGPVNFFGGSNAIVWEIEGAVTFQDAEEKLFDRRRLDAERVGDLYLETGIGDVFEDKVWLRESAKDVALTLSEKDTPLRAETSPCHAMAYGFSGKLREVRSLEGYFFTCQHGHVSDPLL